MRDSLKELGGLAASLGYSPGSIRKLVERGKLIAVIRGKTYYSHPSLFHGRKQ